MSKIGKQLIAAALESLDVIGEVAAAAIGKDNRYASVALAVIKEIVESVRSGRAKEIDPAEVRAKIEASLKSLEDAIAADRKGIRDSLDQRFQDPPANPPPPAPDLEDIATEPKNDPTAPPAESQATD